MQALKAITTRITKKRVSTSEGAGHWSQDEKTIFVPSGDEEGLLHELAHWIVATDAEREWPNLALDDDDKDTNRHLPKAERLAKFPPEGLRERQSCAFERLVYKTAGKPVPAHSSCKSYKSNKRHEAWGIERIRALGLDPEAFVRELAGVVR